MSVHVIPPAAAQRIGPLCMKYLRVANEQDFDAGTITFYDDLTPSEVDRLAALVQLAQMDTDLIDVETLIGLRGTVGSIRDHRTRSNADWSAMTAAQRDSALIDWCRNLTDVLRAILRD